jgi:hypothetical protein
MKKLFISLILLLNLSTIYAIEEKIKLPEANVLAKRFIDAGLDHFVKMTELHKKLGGKEKSLNTLIFVVGLAWCEYEKITKNPIELVTLKKNTKKTIVLILQDNQKTIDI